MGKEKIKKRRGERGNYHGIKEKEKRRC